VTEGRSIAAIGAEVVGAGAEGSNVKTGSDLGVGQLEDRTKGDDTEPLATEDGGRLGDRVAFEGRQLLEDTFEASIEDLVAPLPLGDRRPFVVDFEKQDRCEGDIGGVAASPVSERSALCVREDPKAAKSGR
jgi:hypothetical protein